MPGPPAADPERRVRRNVDAVNVVVAPVDVAPSPPALKYSALVDEWLELWAHPLARTIVATDVPALRRLFEMRDELHELTDDIRLSPLVEGSLGQLVLNPLHKRAQALEKAIAALEDRFGLTPKARLGVGIRLGQLADLEERHRERASGERRSPRADPRLTDVVPGVPPADPGDGEEV